MQLEVLSKFFIGKINKSQTVYIDEFRVVAYMNLISIGFWFDCLTSVPWSYLDFYAYWVSILAQSFVKSMTQMQ